MFCSSGKVRSVYHDGIESESDGFLDERPVVRPCGLLRPPRGCGPGGCERARGPRSLRYSRMKRSGPSMPNVSHSMRATSTRANESSSTTARTTACIMGGNGMLNAGSAIPSSPARAMISPLDFTKASDPVRLGRIIGGTRRDFKPRSSLHVLEVFAQQDILSTSIRFSKFLF